MKSARFLSESNFSFGFRRGYPNKRKIYPETQVGPYHLGGAFPLTILPVQDTMNRHTADPHALCNLISRQPLSLKRMYLLTINARLPALIHALGLGLLNSLSLTLANDVPLELGKRAHHL